MRTLTDLRYKNIGQVLSLKKQFKPFPNEAKRCWFLLIMSFASFAFFALLNLHIGYEVIKYFFGDGWSFLGGLFIAMSFIVTIPALILSAFSIRMVRHENHKKYILPVSLGIIAVLVGAIVHNATELWIYIIAFGVLLLISCFLCAKDKKKDSTIESDLKEQSSPKQISTNNNGTFKIVKAFQIVGLALLFISGLSLIGSFLAANKTVENNQTLMVCFAIFISMIFILHLIVSLSFFKKKKWASSFKYIESYIILAGIILIALSAAISEGVSFILVVSFGLFIAIFIYLIISYKKLKKSNIFLFLLIAFVNYLLYLPNELSAQDNNKMREINLLDKNDFNSYVEFFSTDITDYFNPEKSSPYPSTNLFDGYLKTCWVAGSVKQSEKPILYIKIPENIPIDKLILNIFSGYGKSKSLYMKNAHPKNIKVSIFVAYNLEGYATEVAVKYLIKKFTIERNILLADTFGVQSFPLNLNHKDLIDFQNMNFKNCTSSLKNDDVKINLSFMLKFEITDVYKGSEYDDICISEIFFNNRFVTAYPDMYNQINNVYIQDENTLVADYSDKKGVIIYKDTTSILILVSPR